MAKPRRNLNKTTKECPAPQSEAPTLLLTPFSTHLSFRWTLPLSHQRSRKLSYGGPTLKKFFSNSVSNFAGKKIIWNRGDDSMSGFSGKANAMSVVSHAGIARSVVYETMSEPLYITTHQWCLKLCWCRVRCVSDNTHTNKNNTYSNHRFLKLHF